MKNNEYQLYKFKHYKSLWYFPCIDYNNSLYNLDYDSEKKLNPNDILLRISKYKEDFIGNDRFIFYIIKDKVFSPILNKYLIKL